MEALIARDDEGGWHHSRQSSYEGTSGSNDSTMEGDTLESLLWPPELLWTAPTRSKHRDLRIVEIREERCECIDSQEGERGEA